MKTYLQIDLEQNPWIKTNSKKIKLGCDLARQINSILRVGYNVTTNVESKQLSYNIIDHSASQASSIVETIKEDLEEDIMSHLEESRKAYKKYIKGGNEEMAKSLDEYSKQLNTNIDKVNGLLQLTNSTMTELLAKNSKTIAKGNVGEKLVENVIDNHFKDMVCQDTSSTAHSGDLILCCNDLKIMVECKKYMNTVPTKEVKKFHEDLYTQKIHYGIMVSLDSKIANKKQFDMEIIGDECKKYIIYCSIASEESIIWAIMVIKTLASIIPEIPTRIDNNLDNMVKALPSLLENIDKASDGWERFKSRLEKNIKEYQKIQTTLNESKTSFINDYLHLIQDTVVPK